MVYSRRRRFRKPFKKRYRRKTKSNFALTKRVNTLARRVNMLRYLTTQRHLGTFPITGTAAAPYALFPMNHLASGTIQLQEIFSAAMQQGGGKYTGKRCHMDIVIQPDTETRQDVTMTVFLVSPKNMKVVNETYDVNNTNLSRLILDTDYTENEGAAYLNLKRWKVHKCWNKVQTRPIVTQLTSPLEEFQGSQKQIRLRHSMRNLLRLNNRQSDWFNVLPREVTPSQRLELIIFNNNTGTTAPSCDVTYIQTGYTSK